MSTDKDVICRLPGPWQGLFDRLTCCERGRMWYQEVKDSQYGHNPAWYTLLTSLAVMDPSIEQGKLLFKPRLLHLSPTLQKNFLTLLLEESGRVSDADVSNFLKTMLHHCEECGHSSDENILELHNMAKMRGLWTITDTKPNQPATNHHLLKDEPMECNSEESNEASTTVPSPTEIIVIDEDEEDEDIGEPACKRQRLESQSDPEMTASQSNRESNCLKEIVCDTVCKDIDREMEDLLRKNESVFCTLKEVWYNGVKDSPCPKELEKIVLLSMKEMEVFCKYMCFDSMSDDSTEVVCQHICTLAELLSYTSVSCLLTFVMLKKAIQLSEDSSRSFSRAATIVVQKFPKQLIESVLVPCLLEEELSSVQSELMCRVMKEKLSCSNRSFFLQKIVESDFSVNETNIPVVQTLIDAGCDITEGVYSDLLDCLSKASVALPKNSKFGKLLLAIVQKLGGSLSMVTKTKFEQVLSHHQTFLKKTILNALNKVKVSV